MIQEEEMRRKVEALKRRMRNDAPFHAMYQRMRAAFDAGVVTPEAVRDVLFVYEERWRFQETDHGVPG
jgi:hypothetical protein